MAGAVLDRELSAPRMRAPVRFVTAEPAHDAAIRRLLRENPMAGAIRLGFEREPDFFASTGVLGAQEDTILAFAEDRLICMGRCAVRPCWLDGAVKRVGYLSELRLDRAAGGRFDILRGGYAFFRSRQLHQPADIHFTSIAADNLRARRLLERGARGFPTYTFLGDFVTLVASTARCCRHTATGRWRFERGTPAHAAEIAAFLNRHASRYDLAAEWTATRVLDLARHALPLDHFHLAWAGDRLVACAALWDQRVFRQTTIRGYAPMLRLIRPALNVAARIIGGVELPPVGAVVAHAFVSPLAVAEAADDVLPELLGAIRRDAVQRGIRLLTFGFAATDPRFALVRGHCGGREYHTRLYRVQWPDEDTDHGGPSGRLYMPEVALL